MSYTREELIHDLQAVEAKLTEIRYKCRYEPGVSAKDLYQEKLALIRHKNELLSQIRLQKGRRNEAPPEKIDMSDIQTPESINGGENVG